MYRYSSSSNQAAFRSDTPLSNDQIARYAPSVLATEAHESRGDRYAFIPTISVLDGLRNEGFQPFEVRQTKCRDEGKREHTKHLIRLRHDGIGGTGAEVPEIILLNSHDGSSSYQLLAGYFRFVCQNGLIAGDVVNDIRIRHTGNVVNDVIEGSYTVLDNLRQVGERIDTYKAIELRPDEQAAFAQAATLLRWDEDKVPVDPERLLQIRRWDDKGNDLWRVFNRAQESLLQGGVRGRTTTGKRTTTRAVGGVNENVKLNKALWSLADSLARFKAGETWPLKEAA